eukprot:TRINITY_DN41723_c0_g1_i1.p1 TRINITY_DN41723_c0_g1~~TRINITY_DN41723_c0_g1_i1.p1  ORF type:complete len:209 (+),score=29.09 TRINITY_DN41723_c0_g1_i1:89-715(+)
MEGAQAWTTSNQSVGIGYHDPMRRSQAREQRVAGLTTSDAAYQSAANDYPRFERQMIRTLYDKDIQHGRKEPHPELLRRYPNKEIPHPDDPEARRHRPPTGFSQRSDRTNASRASSDARSRRSAASMAGSSIASSVMSVPPSGYYRQARTPNSMYLTTADRIGGGGHVPPEPQPGREVWMIGRGGGQQSSFDSCLVHKGRQVPWCKSD